MRFAGFLLLCGFVFKFLRWTRISHPILSSKSIDKNHSSISWYARMKQWLQEWAITVLTLMLVLSQIWSAMISREYTEITRENTEITRKSIEASNRPYLGVTGIETKDSVTRPVYHFEYSLHLPQIEEPEAILPQHLDLESKYVDKEFLPLRIKLRNNSNIPAHSINYKFYISSYDRECKKVEIYPRMPEDFGGLIMPSEHEYNIFEISKDAMSYPYHFDCPPPKEECAITG